MSGMTLGWLKMSMRVTSFSSLFLSSTANRAITSGKNHFHEMNGDVYRDGRVEVKYKK